MVEFLLGQFTKNQIFEYPKECLTGIGFGLETSDDDKEAIKDMVKESGCNPRCFTVELDNIESKFNKVFIEN